MNILLVNHYAGGPLHGMEFRTYYTAYEWVKMGHRVTIVAASYSHVRAIQPEVKADFKLEEIDGIQYFWIKTNTYKGNGLPRLWSIFLFVMKMYRYAKRIIKLSEPDVVIASSTHPLDVYPCRSIARRQRARFVFEVHDLWPLSPIELGGFSRYHPFIMLLQKAENDACRYCDKAVSLLPNTKGHLVEHGLIPEKFVYIPNGIHLDDWKDVDPDVSLFDSLKEIRKQYDLLIGYVGSHGLANALDDLIDAADLLRDKSIGFVFVGKGPGKEQLQQKAVDMHLENVFFLAPVPKKTVPGLLSHFDALFIGWQKSPLYRFGISPNKLFDYMMSGKIIIHAVDAANDPVADSSCGFSTEPGDVPAIASAIRRMTELGAEERRLIGARGKEYVLKHHNYEVLSKKFLEAIS